MFKEAILTFICFILFVKGKPNLILMKGSEKLVSSIQIIRNGTNFTVTCVIEDLKSKTKPIDLIFWTNCDLSTKRREVNSITLCKPGSYCCISDKYKLLKRLHLIVRDEPDFVRRKRSQYQFGNQYRNAIPNLNHFGTQISPINIQSPVRHLFDGSSKKTPNKDPSIYIDDDDIFMPSSGGNVITSNNNYHSRYGDNDVLTSYPESKHIETPPPIYVSEHNDGSNNIYIYVYIIYSIESNDEEILRPVYVSEHKDAFNVIYFFAIVLAFIIISLLIYCMSKKRSAPVAHAPIDTNVGTNNTNNEIEYCNHVFCARYRSTNTEANPELSCYLAVLTPNNAMPLTAIETHDDDGGFSILSNLIRNDETDSNSTRPYSNITSNPIEHCNHIFCSRYRSTNTEANPELGCYLAVLTPTIQSNDNGRVTILTSLIRNNGTDVNPVRPYSDSPPAYGISTRTSPLHLREDVLNEIDVPPPSYHQAVANMNLDPPPDFDSSVNQALLSTTSASSSNVVHIRAPPLRDLRAPVVHHEI